MDNVATLFDGSSVSLDDSKVCTSSHVLASGDVNNVANDQQTNTKAEENMRPDLRRECCEARTLLKKMMGADGAAKTEEELYLRFAEYASYVLKREIEANTRLEVDLTLQAEQKPGCAIIVSQLENLANTRLQLATAASEIRPIYMHVRVLESQHVMQSTDAKHEVSVCFAIMSMQSLMCITLTNSVFYDSRSWLQCFRNDDKIKTKQDITELNTTAMSIFYTVQMELKRPTNVPGKWSRQPTQPKTSALPTSAACCSCSCFCCQGRANARHG